MSGDAGGLIAALVLAPVVLAGAAVVGVAYGALHAGGYLLKGANNYAQKKKKEKQLVVDNCSAELDGIYRKMESVIQNQADAFSTLSAKTSAQIDRIAKELQAEANNAPAADLAALNKTLDKARDAMTKSMHAHSEVVKTDILDKGREDLVRCAKALESADAAKADLVEWKTHNAAALAQQKAAAYDALRDARASVKLMQKLAAASRNDAFRLQTQTMEEACIDAGKKFVDGMYEASFTGSRAVIRQVAMNVASQQAEQLELDFAAMQLQARMEGLIAELEQRRYLHIPTASDCDEDLDEDLNDYSQGKYAEIQALLAKKLDEIRNPANYTSVWKMTQEFENELEPRATHIVEVSQQVMQGYHEKLRILDAVEEFMESQNYQMDWAAPVGDDMSQKLVVHFVNKQAKSSISVTLDSEATAGSVAKMAMEVLTFYSNGNPVSEAEKAQLRQELNLTLKKAGVMGSISCQGQMNQPSSKPEMNTEAGVLAEPIQRIL